MSRKSNVFVKGQRITGQMYRDAVVDALEHNANNYMTVDQMVSYGSSNGLFDKKSAYRLGNSHPLWKIVSNMSSEPNSILEKSTNHKGILVYRLKQAKHLYINGIKYRLYDSENDEYEIDD